MPITNLWDQTFPPDTQLANLLGQDIRNLKLDIQQRMGFISGTLANRWNPGADIQPTNWTGLLYFTTDTNQVFQWSGAAWVDVTSQVGSGRFKLESSNIVPVTVANSIALSPLQAIVVNTPDIGASQTFYIDATGVMGASGSPTLVFGLYLDSTLLVNLSPTTGSITQSWTVRTFFTCTTAGAAGKITSPLLDFNNSLVAPLNGVVTPGLISIDTTVNHTIQFQVQWGAASPSNTITSNAMNIHRIG